jgi:hypothetical protein
MLLADLSEESGARLQRAIADARLLLAPRGRTLLFAGYDRLEGAPEALGAHPIIFLRRALHAAGLDCVTVEPLEVGAAHVLAVSAIRQAGAAPQLLDERRA